MSVGGECVFLELGEVRMMKVIKKIVKMFSFDNGEDYSEINIAEIIYSSQDA